jgi:hypothetical protein
MGLFPFGGTPGFQRQAATPVAGFALQVGATPTILSWTAPSDGLNHRFQIFATGFVTVIEAAGGQVNVNYALPNGNTSPFPLLLQGAQGVGYVTAAYVAAIIGPGAIVSIQQSSALTTGAATVWAEIWGS